MHAHHCASRLFARNPQDFRKCASAQHFARDQTFGITTQAIGNLAPASSLDYRAKEGSEEGRETHHSAPKVGNRPVYRFSQSPNQFAECIPPLPSLRDRTRRAGPIARYPRPRQVRQIVAVFVWTLVIVRTLGQFRMILSLNSQHGGGDQPSRRDED